MALANRDLQPPQFHHHDATHNTMAREAPTGPRTSQKRVRDFRYDESEEMRDERIIAGGYADRLVRQALEFTTKLPHSSHREISKDVIFKQHMKAQIALSSGVGDVAKALDGIAKALEPLDNIANIADNIDYRPTADIASATEGIASAAEGIASALENVSTSIDDVAKKLAPD